MAAAFPYLSYSDGAAAIAWLEAIGFVTVVRQDDEGGAVQHADRARVLDPEGHEWSFGSYRPGAG